MAIVSAEKKDISSSYGHVLADSSPYFTARLAELPVRIEKCRESISSKNFTLFGECIEADALSMHCVMMTSSPSILYWNAGTIQIMQAVKKWRKEGLESYFTIDAGANVHVICEGKDKEVVDEQLRKLSEVRETIVNESAEGCKIL